jgi:hypothetical protein
VTERKVRLLFHRSRAPFVTFSVQEWDMRGDLTRKLYGVSLIRGQWMSQGLEKYTDGSWAFNFGPVCIWLEIESPGVTC